MWRLFKKQSQQGLLSDEKLDYRRLPAMAAEDLYIYLKIHNRILKIKRKVGIDGKRFEKMYADPIAKFCELAQLMPASQAHHHAFPGGLIVHTLSVIENAIHERQKYTLPLASEPEIIEAQKNLWTYAVFAAAILHDVGKITTMVDFIDIDRKAIVYPIAGSLLAQNVVEYQIAFKPTTYYKLHESIGLSYFTLLFDATCCAYLTSDLNIFAEVMGYVHNDHDSWGSIGEIVRHADQYSVAEDLKIATQTQRRRQFTGAVIENFGERLMRTLRMLINERQLAINKPGAVLFTSNDGRYVYAVSKSLVERIREKMQQMGATDIPNDNTRIFDELQQNGFVESNGQFAVFKIQVQLPDYNFNQSFTCLKFIASKLFHINNMPESHTGSVHEIQDKPNSKTEQNKKKSSASTSSHQTTGHNEDVSTMTSPVEAKVEDDSTTTPAANDTLDTVDSVSDTDSDQPNKETLKDPELIVNGFFTWLSDNVDKKEIIINRSGQPLYKVRHEGKDVLAIVSPKTFAEYAVFADLYTAEGPLDASSMKQAATLVQSAIHKQKLNIPSNRGQLHYRKPVTAHSAKARLSLYFIEVEKIPNKTLKDLLLNLQITEILT